MKSYTTYFHQRKQVELRQLGLIGQTRHWFRSVILDVCAMINQSSEANFLRCLHCHNVFDDQVNDFENLIIRLKAMGTFVDTDTCINMLQGTQAIDKKYFHLSFDDGFKNNYTNVVPILSKHNIPAIFFVPSALIEASFEDIEKFCFETTDYHCLIEMMTWDELREMLSLGFEIGSHTQTHARFSTISHDLDLLRNEILGSKLQLEANLNTECKYISWPYGRLKDADVTSLEMVKSAGYHACFGGFRGSVSPGKTDRFNIPRHHIEPHWPIAHNEYFARGNMELI